MTNTELRKIKQIKNNNMPTSDLVAAISVGKMI